jgi:hypothetical protein
MDFFKKNPWKALSKTSKKREKQTIIIPMMNNNAIISFFRIFWKWFSTAEKSLLLRMYTLNKLKLLFIHHKNPKDIHYSKANIKKGRKYSPNFIMIDYQIGIKKNLFNIKKIQPNQSRHYQNSTNINFCEYRNTIYIITKTMFHLNLVN